MPCMAMYAQPQSGINVGRLLRKALAAKNMSVKQAAIWMVGPTYETTLSRAINGLAPLDAWAIANLPLPVLWKFCRLFIAAKLKQWEADTCNERRSA